MLLVELKPRLEENFEVMESGALVGVACCELWLLWGFVVGVSGNGGRWSRAWAAFVDAWHLAVRVRVARKKHRTANRAVRLRVGLLREAVVCWATNVPAYSSTSTKTKSATRFGIGPKFPTKTLKRE